MPFLQLITFLNGLDEVFTTSEIIGVEAEILAPSWVAKIRHLSGLLTANEEISHLTDCKVPDPFMRLVNSGKRNRGDTRKSSEEKID